MEPDHPELLAHCAVLKYAQAQVAESDDEKNGYLRAAKDLKSRLQKIRPALVKDLPAF